MNTLFSSNKLGKKILIHVFLVSSILTILATLGSLFFDYSEENNDPVKVEQTD